MSDKTKAALAAACVAVSAFLLLFAVDLTGASGDDTTTTTGEPTTETTATTEPTTTTTEEAPPRPVGGDPNDPTYIRAGYPDDTTTGPSNREVDEGQLPACTGQAATGTITTAGLVVSDCKVDTVLKVQAPNVTLQGVVVRSNTSSTIVQNTSTGLIIEDSIIGPLNPDQAAPNASTGESCGAAVGQGNYTLRRSEVWGCADGVKVANTTVLADNFFHDYDKTSGPSGTTHNDSFQKNDNTDLASLTVVGNAFYHYPCVSDTQGSSNRHWQAKNTTTATVDIRGNLFYGSHGLVNDDGTGSDVTGQVTGNVLAGSSAAGPFSPNVGDVFTVGSAWSGVDFSGNTFETDGAALPASGALGDYHCDRMPVGG